MMFYAHQRSRSEKEQVSYTPQTCLRVTMKKRSRSHNMLWYVSKIFETCSCMPKTCKTHFGISRVECAGTGTSSAQCIRRKEKWDLPHRRHSVLTKHALFEWRIVLMCHTCAHKTHPGIVHTHVSRVVVCRCDSFGDVPKLSKAAGGGGTPKEKARCWCQAPLIAATIFLLSLLGILALLRYYLIFVEFVLRKVRKGTGYVALSDLPDDEEEKM